MSGSLTHRVRCRVGGLLIRRGSVLLIHMELPTRNGPVWMPPGGEVEFGESLSSALKREFKEETGLQVQPESLAYVNEFREPPYHAIEHYFSCQFTGGTLRKGKDPEMDAGDQMIQKVAYKDLDLVRTLSFEPSYIRDRLNKDWKSHRLTETRWIQPENTS